MKYVFIIFGFFPIYLLMKLIFLVIIFVCSLISFIWNFNFKKSINCFKEWWEVFFEGSTFNPIYAWSHFLNWVHDREDYF